MLREPPSRLISVATTSMPTPRPACCVTDPAVENPGSRISCIASSSEIVCPVLDQSQLQALVADGAKLHARAVVAHFDHDLGAFALQVQMNRARLALAARDALLGRLDAVDHRVAQHVLERRQHPLQHLPVELPRGAADDEFGALAGFGRRLAHDARQPLHVALERHHARAHQAVLQLRDRARLLLQQVLRLLHQALQQPLDARHVARGLGEAARELLDGRVPVQFQRIEFGAMPGFLLVTVQDLLFGLDLQLALLFLQTRHGARQLAEVEFDRAHLLFEAGARNADLAGHVQQLIEQLGIDAGHLRPVRMRHRLAARGHRQCGRRRRHRLRQLCRVVPVGRMRVVHDRQRRGAGTVHRHILRAPAPQAQTRPSKAPSVSISKLPAAISGCGASSGGASGCGSSRACAGCPALRGCAANPALREPAGCPAPPVHAGCPESPAPAARAVCPELPAGAAYRVLRATARAAATRAGSLAGTSALRSVSAVRASGERCARRLSAQACGRRAPRLPGFSKARMRPIRSRACATPRPAATLSRMRASSSTLACSTSKAAGVAGMLPASMKFTSDSSSWLRSPMAVMPAMRAPPLSVCSGRFSAADLRHSPDPRARQPAATRTLPAARWPPR